MKWHAGKQRKALRSDSATALEGRSSARSTPSAGEMSRRRHKKRDPELSQLEKLPTEVLQAIFEYSANLDLPLASPRLAAQFASKHLQNSLASIILQSVLDSNEPSDRELRAAMRLMNSNFFTWQFFHSWLLERFEEQDLLSSCLTAMRPDEDQLTLAHREEWAWYKLNPNRNLPPPLKLLHGPFTQDKVRFLQILCSSFRPAPETISPVYLETAQQGFRQAVSEGTVDALQAFRVFGLLPDTELLRLAVIDSGCDKDIVRILVNRAISVSSEPTEVNFLDPALWSWAEKAQANGDDKGSWLKDLLKDAARRTGRKDVIIKRASSVLYE
jgi:hypothetical protein